MVAHPAIARVLAGIRRAYGTKQAAKTEMLSATTSHFSKLPP